ncbi:MAG: cysteine synthase A [Oscillospiraceae bacterium]|jgi:cysteine synthase A
MKIFNSVSELVGSTPLLRLSGKRPADILLKLEYFNPAGSVKDRIGLKLILDAERRGLLSPGGTIIEPTSGNTGIGLAAFGRARGYRVILTMPDTMSVERRSLLRAYGAELVLTDGNLGMAGAAEKAEQLHREIPNSYIPGQFGNPANPEAHYQSTGPEIWRDTDGNVDIFIATIGTGGTITGTGRYLKEKNPGVKIIGVEPFESPLLTQGRAGSHGIQGIGPNFVPVILDRSVIDEIITVKTDDALKEARALPSSDGLLAGISSGAAVFAAKTVAARPDSAGKLIVALLPDSGERYLSVL